MSPWELGKKRKPEAKVMQFFKADPEDPNVMICQVKWWASILFI
jgi:hypothetical protein